MNPSERTCGSQQTARARGGTFHSNLPYPVYRLPCTHIRLDLSSLSSPFSPARYFLDLSLLSSPLSPSNLFFRLEKREHPTLSTHTSHSASLALGIPPPPTHTPVVTRFTRVKYTHTHTPKQTRRITPCLRFAEYFSSAYLSFQLHMCAPRKVCAIWESRV